MCGRFALFTPIPQLTKKVGAVLPEHEIRPRYNVAPGTWIASIRKASDNSAPTLEEMWWGFRPSWAKGKGTQPINARVETVATNPFFKGAFAKHRCLVAADVWYEWIKNISPKQPHFLCRRDREPLHFAAIYAERDDGHLECAILTEPVRGSAADVHDRMPLILNDDSLASWLAPDLMNKETIRNLVEHIDEGLIEHWPVSTAVNKPLEGQGDELINPL